MEQLVKENPEGVIHMLAFTAGRVQHNTGARVIESAIREQEQTQGDTTEYWLTRARYFEGRQEWRQVESAYHKAIELAPIDPVRQFKDLTAYRSRAVSNLARFYNLRQRHDDLITLLWTELEAVEPGSEYADHVLSMILHYDNSNRVLIQPDDERLWTQLAARPTWSYHRERILYRMAKRSKTLDDLWQRAEALTLDADPSRAMVLGRVMTRHDANARAIPLLKSAIARLTDPNDRASATFVLFEAYLARDDWQEVESLWPQAQQRLGPREIPSWLIRIEQAARNAGEPHEAERFAATRANLDYRYAR